MHAIVVTGATKYGDPMDRPYVAVPVAMWQASEAASQQVVELTQKLEGERALSAKITQEFQDYMREHQVLHTQQQQKVGR